MHTASEMAVAINCFCVVIEVAIMLLAVCWGRGWSRSCQLWPGWKLEFKARSIFFWFKSLEPTLNNLNKSHDQYFVVTKSTTLWPFLHLSSNYHHRLVACQQTSKPLTGHNMDEGAQMTVSCSLGKDSRDRKDVDKGSRRRCASSLCMFFF